MTPALEAARAAARKEVDVKPRSPWMGAALLVAVEVLVAAGSALVLGARNQASPEAIAAVGALWILGMLASALFALGRLPQRAWMGWLAALWVAAMVSVPLGASGYMPEMATHSCAWMEALLSLLPVAVAVGLLTRFADQPVRTFFAALSAGATGVIALHVHCPNGTLPHLILMHLAPWLAVAGLAVLVRRRLRSRTFAP